MYTSIRCSVKVKSSIQLLEIVQKSGKVAFEIITENRVSTKSI